MYLEHFSLEELPFTITPDTAFFMSRAGYQDALNVLLVALRSGEGFVKVTGEVGTGKTILCRKLLSTLSSECVTAYIPNPYLKPGALLLSIADELGIKYSPKTGQHAFMKSVRAALVAYHEQGKRVVVCLDEAQAMPVATLETLRLLSNLETEKSKLIQVVLFGQPELDKVLEQPSIRQLRQRITFSYELLPLNRVALTHYMRHRLAVAGHSGQPLFSKSGLDLLFSASHGIPRIVNILAHKALMAAFGAGDYQVVRRHLKAAIRDTADARSCEAPRKAWLSNLWFTRWMVGIRAMAVGALLLGLAGGVREVMANLL